MTLAISFLWSASCVLAQLPLQSDNQPPAELYRKFSRVKLFAATRAEIEAIFPIIQSKDSLVANGSKTTYYDLPGADLTVFYTVGRCTGSASYAVPDATVIGIDLYFHEAVKSSELEIDLSRFHSFREHDNNARIFTDEGRGIEIQGGNGLIHSISRSPTQIENHRNRCKNQAVAGPDS